MKKFKNENGAITMVVLLSILFMVSFLISTYVIVANKVKTQKEMVEQTRAIYENTASMEEIYNSYFNEGIIPIYSNKQYLAVGKGETIEIQELGGKFYKFSPDGTYVLYRDLVIYENELPENWEAPEYYFMKNKLSGKIDYNGHVVKIIYNDGKEEIYNGEIKGLFTSIYYLDENGKEQVILDSNATLQGYANRTDITKVEVGSVCKKIDASAFSGCTNLKIEKIPEGVTLIEAGAFSGCTSLTRIEIPNVTYGWQAFAYCTGLEEIVLGGIGRPITKTIGTSTFTGCTNSKLEFKIYVPTGTTSIANMPQANLNPTIEYYDATTGELVNLRIGGGKYRGNTEINWTTIPNEEKITEIGYGAFTNCTNLALTSLPEKITSIRSSTFSGCTNLKIEKIPEGVTLIEAGAFSGCTSLTRIEIPDVTYGYNAFANCTGLEEIVLGGIGKPITKTIGTSTFTGCTNSKLEFKIYVPTGTTSIANMPQDNLNPTVEYYDATTGELVNLRIGGGKYRGNTEINWTTIPNEEKITEIGYGAFTNCTNLALTSLPEKITSIRSSTFSGCTNLKIEKIPEGVTLIEAGAFSGCTSLTRIEIPNAGCNYNAFVDCKGLEEIVLGGIGKPITATINSSAFSGCTQTGLVMKIYVESGTTSIAGAPFGATMATVEYYDATTGELVNLRIGGGKYRGNTEINWTQIPNEDKVTEIGERAFENCTNLALAKLPENITAIGKSTFSGCTNLKIEKIPEGVTSIEPYAFAGCKALTRIEIPNAGCNYHAFVDCKGLEEIVLGGIGKPITATINSSAFSGCTQTGLVMKIYVESGTTSIAGAPFGATRATVEYYDATTGELIPQ